MATVELKNKDREVELSIEKHIFDEDTKKRIYVAEVIKKALNQYLDYFIFFGHDFCIIPYFFRV